MLGNFLGRFSRDMGIDLGTSKIAVYVKTRGLVISEPSVVAINIKTNRLLAVGEEAKRMLGKTPPHILVTRPVTNGVISDFEACEKMLEHFIQQVHGERYFLVPRPRVVATTPLHITEVERKAVEDAILAAGARAVNLVETPIAAAVGARLPLVDSNGIFIAILGGGTSEIAVLSLSGIVTARALKMGGEEMDHNIVNYVREKSNLIIGERTAEEIKIRIGAVEALEETLEMLVRGRDVVTGLPREITLTNREVSEAIWRTVHQIVEAIAATLEATPPELVADIHESGLVLAGGVAQLRGLATLIAKEAKIPVRVADDPTTVVVRGTGILLENLSLLKEVSFAFTSA